MSEIEKRIVKLKNDGVIFLHQNQKEKTLERENPEDWLEEFFDIANTKFEDYFMNEPKITHVHCWYRNDEVIITVFYNKWDSINSNGAEYSNARLPDYIPLSNKS